MSSNVTDEVVAKRIKLYGDPVETFVRIAEVWSGILGHTIQPAEVPLMMAGMKLVRAQVSPDYSDNNEDVDGYMEIFRMVMGEDMIHARTPDQYWAEVEKRTSARVQEAVNLMAADVPDENPQQKVNTITPCFHCGESFMRHDLIGGVYRCHRPGFEHNFFVAVSS